VPNLPREIWIPNVTMGHVRCAVTLWYWYSDAYNSADSAPFCYFFFKFNLLAQFLDSKCGELVDEQLCVFGIKYLAVNSVKLEKISDLGHVYETSQANYSLDVQIPLMARNYIFKCI
jgi:hypothetical protein